jgi:hypothetical protein
MREVARHFHREDAKVQKDDRDLGDDNNRLVDELLDPEDLNARISQCAYKMVSFANTDPQHLSYVVKSDSPDIMTHTFLLHY